MMKTRTTTTAGIAILAAAAATFGGSVTLAFAASASETIAARQANYKKMGGAMKKLGDALKAGGDDKATMASAAKTLAETAHQQPAMFPSGTGPSSGVKTKALPGIWTDRAKFDGMMKNLITQADKLATVAAGGDVAAITAQYKATGGTCSACHKQFRAD